jgi:cysteine synthase A
MRLAESIGRTPLIEIESLSRATGCRILAKAEFMNPGGSVKDRAALAMIEAAEASGELRPGGVIVEGTAGNTGIGLTMLGLKRGYRVIICMPDNQAAEKYELLEAMGAEVRRFQPVPFANSAHFYHQARELAAQTPGAWWANQFENLANLHAHETTTGPEILADLQRDGLAAAPLTFVSAVGTGGTIAGVSRVLKRARPDVRVVVADPYGSGMYGYVQDKKLETVGSSITEGIGIMRVTANFAQAQVDAAIRVDDQLMLDVLFHLARVDGLFVGTSAALNVAAAFTLAKQAQGRGEVFVTMLCDHGSRYASKLLSEEWLASKKLLRRPNFLADQMR